MRAWSYQVVKPEGRWCCQCSCEQRAWPKRSALSWSFSTGCSWTTWAQRRAEPVGVRTNIKTFSDTGWEGFALWARAAPTVCAGTFLNSWIGCNPDIVRICTVEQFLIMETTTIIPWWSNADMLSFVLHSTHELWCNSVNLVVYINIHISQSISLSYLLLVLLAVKLLPTLCPSLQLYSIT